MPDTLSDEMGEEWLRVERAIWPDGPAHGHGSGEYAALKARIIKLLAHLDALTAAVEALPDFAFAEEMPDAPRYIDRAAVLAILKVPHDA